MSRQIKKRISVEKGALTGLDDFSSKLPSYKTLAAVDDERMSGRRPCPFMFTLSIDEMRKLKAALSAVVGSKD